MDDRAAVAIWMLSIGAIVGVLLGLLTKKGVLYGLFWGLIFSVIGWAIILLGKDEPGSNQDSEKRRKWTKIARIIVGSLLTVISVSGLVSALTSPIPEWENARHISFTLIALVAMTGLGAVVLWKGLKKGKGTKQKEETLSEGGSGHE